MNELAPALTNLSRHQPFSVPDGYFDGLALELLSKTWKAETRPSVPEGYFDALPGTLLDRIKTMQAAGEIEELAPTLGGISREMPYAVPEGYFDQFRVSGTGGSTPVVPMRKTNRSFQWAIAACVIFLVGLFAWENLSKKQTISGAETAANTSETDTTISAALAGIEDASLHQELANDAIENEIGNAVYYLHADNIETALHELTDEEIKSQLGATAVAKNKS